MTRDGDQKDRVVRQLSNYDSPAIAVISALAEARDVPPDSLPPLEEWIDLEALDQVLDRSYPTGDAIRVRFTVETHEVVATGTRVVVTERFPDEAEDED